MPSKIKKLYKKTKKSFKNIVSFKKHTKGQEAKPKGVLNKLCQTKK